MNKKMTVLTRRQLLKTVGTMAAVAPMVSLTACGGSSGKQVNSDSNAVATVNADVESTDVVSSEASIESSDWLHGGTAAMEVDFPPLEDPFNSGLGNLCKLTDEFTLGPCYFDVVDDRDDISEGQPGVPMTLVMKLVDRNCAAIEGAVIDVWWCNAEGVYSGDNSASTGRVSRFASGFCTGNDTRALASRWFRGIKTTDSQGNVYFKACFPGWYPSRTTHIHFRIVLNGSEQLVSQFGFDDELSNAIYLNHPDYTGMAKDTNNQGDTVFPANGYEDYLFEVERQWDNSMLVYKAIQINR